MAPQTKSKFRHIECKPVARDQRFEQLQVSSSLVESTNGILAASFEHFAFAHQIDSGGAIQVKRYEDTGKEASTTPPLLRGHGAHVNSLAFSPFDGDLLVSAGADAIVNIWTLPHDRLTSDISTPTASVSNTQNSIVVGLEFHPSACNLVAAGSANELALVDVGTGQTPLRTSLSDVHLSSFCWNFDGSLAVLMTQQKTMCAFDPRAATASAPVFEHTAHAGRRNANLVWCGELNHFITVGSDQMQDREMKFWDLRNLTTPLHRERIDSGIGMLFPLYDSDNNLLFLTGKGDTAFRCYEVDLTQPFVHALEHASVANPTNAIALTPKSCCDTWQCEVAKVLQLTSNACEPISFQVPRKEALTVFQSDLYPDTVSGAKPALQATEWLKGANALPNKRAGMPQRAMGWNTPGNAGWGAPAPPATPATTALTAAATAKPVGSPAQPSPSLPPAAPAPMTTASTASPPVENKEATLSSGFRLGVKQESIQDISEKAKRLGAIYSHKLKYIKGEQKPRDRVYRLADQHSVACIPASAMLKANAKYWCLPLAGSGGPVLVGQVDAIGKAAPDAPLLNSQHATVVDTDFNPFVDNVLATGSTDSTIQLWSLASEADGLSVSGTALCKLQGHTKATRTLNFHPTASNVLCSSSADLTLRLWDVEASQERLAVHDKMDDLLYNAAFNFSGSLIATSCRDKVVRVFDPRLHSVVAMACGHEGTKAQFVSWCLPSGATTSESGSSFAFDSTFLFSVGFSSRNDRQLSLWDTRRFLEPLNTITIDSSASLLHPFYDESSKALYLVSSGDRSVLSYELDPSAATPIAHANLPFAYSGDPICGAALLPKQCCNVSSVEVNRLLLLTASSVETVSFRLPRAERLEQYFRDDVFGPLRAPKPVMNADEWLEGMNRTPLIESLRPEGMLALSQKPEEETTARPMTLLYQERRRQEEANKQFAQEQFERLTSLAYQPSLHPPAMTQTVTNSANTIAHVADVDSDDDWED